VFRDTPFVIVQTSEKNIYHVFGCPGGFFFYLLKSSSKGFSFVAKYLVYLTFLYSLFIWLLINVCKVLSDHLLSKRKKGLSKSINTAGAFVNLNSITRNS
jgi:hypothetical protein